MEVEAILYTSAVPAFAPLYPLNALRDPIVHVAKSNFNASSSQCNNQKIFRDVL